MNNSGLFRRPGSPRSSLPDRYHKEGCSSCGVCSARGNEEYGGANDYCKACATVETKCVTCMKPKPPMNYCRCRTATLNRRTTTETMGFLQEDGHCKSCQQVVKCTTCYKAVAPVKYCSCGSVTYTKKEVKETEVMGMMNDGFHKDDGWRSTRSRSPSSWNKGEGWSNYGSRSPRSRSPSSWSKSSGYNKPYGSRYGRSSSPGRSYNKEEQWQREEEDRKMRDREKLRQMRNAVYSKNAVF